jgi:hypothetical protein
MVSKGFISLKDLEFAERILRDIKNSNQRANDFNFGIFYGLVFGVLGNLVVTLLFDYKLKFLPENLKLIVIETLLFLLIIIILISVHENQKFTDINKKLDLEIEKILNLQDLVEGGEKIGRDKILNLI